METSIKKIKHAYFMINISYMSSLAIFGAIFYLYLQQLGFSFLHINLFGGTFWLVNFLTELPAAFFLIAISKQETILSQKISHKKR